MIRSAIESDLPTIAEGMVRLHQLHVDALPSVFRPFSETEAVSYLSDLLTQPDFHIRVATRDKKIAGHAILALESTPANMFKHSQRFGHVIQMDVYPNFQRMGLGRLLLSDIDAIAAKKNLNRILLDAWAFNESAREFFAESGYNQSGTKMIRHIVTNAG